MARSLKKGVFVHYKLLKKIEALNESKKKAGCQNVVTSFYYNT